MRRGGPSINPHGRPLLGKSLADALRHRVSAERIAELAVQLLDGDADADVKLRALDWIARRGYACTLRSMVRRLERSGAAAQDGAA